MREMLLLCVYIPPGVLTGVLWRLVGAGHRQSSLHGTDLPPQHQGVTKRAFPERVCRRHWFYLLWLVRHGSRRGRFIHHGKRPLSSQRGAGGHTHQRHDDSRYRGLPEEGSQGFYHEEGGYGEVQADDDGCFKIRAFMTTMLPFPSTCSGSVMPQKKLWSYYSQWVISLFVFLVISSDSVYVVYIPVKTRTKA